MSGLKPRLKALIAEQGPITTAQFMTYCLHDPAAGYYATRPGLGPQGDFVTAPEVSQMFGELIGVWVMAAWEAMGRPDPVHLVELGPGRGVLMSDVLRAAGLRPDFLKALLLYLIEASPALRLQQQARLAAFAPIHADRLEEVPAGAPLIVLANEFFDCLPARQFVRKDRAWFEQRIGLDAAGELAFGLAPPPSGVDLPVRAKDGAVFEVSAAQEAFGQMLASRLAADGGLALIIDYGRDRPEFGDTFQGLAQHRKIDPLAAPGEADLTVHVDFPAVAAAARAGGAQVSAIVGQGEFLARIGLGDRLAALIDRHPENTETLVRQARRLADQSEMGTLFKVMVISQAGLAVPAFD